MQCYVNKVFSVPLRTKGFGIGICVRQNKNILLGYFFNNHYLTLPKDIQSIDLHENNVCLIAMFGALGIKNGQWTIMGEIPFLYQKNWQAPVFKQQDPILGYYNAIHYSEDLKEIARTKISDEEAMKYYSAGVYGYGAIEIALTGILHPE